MIGRRPQSGLHRSIDPRGDWFKFYRSVSCQFYRSVVSSLTEAAFLPTAGLKSVMELVASQISKQLEALKVLIVDDEQSMRKVTRALLQVIGVRAIYEAGDGRSGLEAICTRMPDVVILDWEMPSPNGPEFVRQVRSPGRFPLPDVPIIMLTAYGERSRVVEAVKLGVNEYLLKPVSSKALLARFVSILGNPRRMVKKGDYYGPEPRKVSTYKPESDPGLSNIVLVN
jgi:two-component system chemotaxis response regulator CheY